jgi:hypothetical protein
VSLNGIGAALSAGSLRSPPSRADASEGKEGWAGRALFRELADGIVRRAGRFLHGLNPAATEADARLPHSLSAGLAVVDLATGRTDGGRRAAAVLETALAALAKGDRQ